MKKYEQRYTFFADTGTSYLAEVDNPSEVDVDNHYELRITTRCDYCGRRNWFTRENSTCAGCGAPL